MRVCATRLLLLSLLPALLAAAACRGRPAPDTARAADAPALTDSVLASLGYPAPMLPGGRVRLSGGEWQGDSTFLGIQSAELRQAALGDLDADGRGDAVVVLFTDPGATGQFFDLIPVLATEAGPAVGRATALGDRVRPESIWIADGLAHLRLITHDSADGLCCPTRREAQRYRLRGDSLVLEHAELLERIGPDLGGT